MRVEKALGSDGCYLIVPQVFTVELFWSNVQRVEPDYLQNLSSGPPSEMRMHGTC